MVCYLILEKVTKMDIKLNKGIYESYMENVRRTIEDTNERVKQLSKHNWVARLNYDQWVEFQKGNIKIGDPLNVEDIRNSRDFRYYFAKGELVKLDESVMNEFELEKYSDLIGLHAVVTDSYSDLHSFAHGSSYSHHVRFENGYETEPCSCAYLDMIPTSILIPINDVESEKYIQLYRNTEDKDSLWFNLK